jgi:glutamate-1-semialdehyde 2,1-aminomutase
MAYGPLILGHGHPVAIEAAKEAFKNGTVLAIAHENEVRYAEVMVAAIPCAERVAFCNSGTEATLHAMRVARARTGKDKVAKFEGGYHGVHDYALVSSILAQPAGSPENPESVPDNPGTPQAVVDQMLTLTYNHPASLEKIRKHKDELAAVIIEPVPSAFMIDMRDFLKDLREVTRACGVLLIFDEVISGFRLSYGGAQEYFGITPDMATYGKIIGGGFPAGAIAGSNGSMKKTIEGNTMAMKKPPHPGLSVKHDCLDPLGLTVTAAAKLLGVTRQTLNDLVHARRGISPEMAIRLDLAFGGGADTWLRMQTTYDLAKVRLTAKGRIKVKRYVAAARAA